MTSEEPFYRQKILYLMAFSSSLGSLAWGYNLSSFNALRVFLQTNVFPGASDFAISLIASLLTLGAAGGSFYAGSLLSKFGRLKVLRYTDIVGIFATFLCMFQSLFLMILGKLIIGVIIGINGVTISLYNIEMAPIPMKGIMSSVSMTLLALGVTFGLVAQLAVPDLIEGKDSQRWRLLMAIPILFHAARLAIFTYILPFDTPLYLTLQNKISEARDVLDKIYIRDVDGQLQRVIKDKEAITAGGSLKFADLLKPKYRRAFFVCLFIMASIQLCGFSQIFVFFNTFITESAGNNSDAVSLFATIMGTISFLSAGYANIIMEKYNRRPLFMIGMTLMAFSSLFYAFLGYVDGPSNGLLKYVVSIWPLFFRTSVGTLAFIYVPEVLPGIGVSITVFFNWMMAFLSVQTCLPLVKMIGTQGLMLFFGLFCAFSVWAYDKYIIESRGRTKAELLELFEAADNNGLSDDMVKNIEMRKLLLFNKSDV